MSMTSISFCVLGVFLAGLLSGVLITALSVRAGFRMGRKTQGLAEAKKFDPGPIGEEKDPYADAMKEPEEEKRIETV